MIIDQILEGLCAFEHRYSTTDNERKAAGFLAGQLQSLDVPAEVEPFTAQTTFSWIYAILYGGFAAAVQIHYYCPLTGFLLAALFTILFIGEQTTKYSPLSRIVPRGSSQNVIGHIATPEAKKTLILCAHYDTSKTALAFAPGTVKNLRLTYLVSLAMIGLIVLGTLLRGTLLRLAPSWPGQGVLGYLMLLALLYMLFMVAAMIEREARGKPVNGAADNASGVAVVLELVRRIKEQGGLPGTDIIALLTGCEETGMVGMSAFIKRHGHELSRDTTWFINFDNLGGGRVNYITGEGMIKLLPADPLLLSIAEELVRDPAFAEVRGRVYNALTLDTLVPRARGFKVITMMGLTDEGLPTPWHWFNDTLDNIDRHVTRAAAEFAWAMIGKWRERV